MTTKALVIGGGVVGALSAYYLSKQGFKVTIVERNQGLGLEASAANANQLSYSHIFPPVAPFIAPKIPRILMGLDPALKVRSLTDIHFWSWVLQAAPTLLSNARYRKVSEEIKAIHEESRSLMAGFVARHDISFSHLKAGRLMLYDTPEDLEHSLEGFQHNGLGQYARTLSYAQALAQEPGLAGRKPFAGALYTPDDETGDCAAFVYGLESILKAQGVELVTGHSVKTLVREGRSIKAIKLDNGDTMEADTFVLTSGVWAKSLLKTCGLDAPIYPVKGYTYEIPGKMPFTASIIDMNLKMVFTPLENSLKVSNGIFFTRLGSKDDKRFLEHVQRSAASIYPKIDFRGATLRSGYRPWTPNSLPIIGKKLDNFFVNIGHGMLGWTMAHGTSKRLADLVGRSS